MMTRILVAIALLLFIAVLHRKAASGDRIVEEDKREGVSDKRFRAGHGFSRQFLCQSCSG